MKKLKQNYVAIIPDQEFGDIGVFDNHDRFNPHLNYRLTGKVVATCDSLNYGGYEKMSIPLDNEHDLFLHRQIVEYSMEWDTDLDVKIGDTVYFRLVNLLDPSDPQNADSVIMIDGQRSVLMNYGDLIAKVEGEKLHPLNGYILIEPLIISQNIGIFELPNKRANTEGVVKFIGKPNKHYLLHNDVCDMLDVKVGDHIVYPKTAAVRIETESYRQYGDFTALDRLQRRHILGVLATR